MRCGVDLTDKRFGHLTAKKNTGQRQDGYYIWRCICDCGGEIFVNTKRLQRGTVTNCGCIPKKTAQNGTIAEDLTGQRFGSLTVLQRADNRKGRVCWKCRCDCGKEKVITAHELKRNETKTCGSKCSSKKYPFVDLQGFTSGFLKVLKKTDQRDEKGSIIWQCVCLRCGNDCYYSADALLHNKNVSCGCYRKEVIEANINNQLRMVDGTCIEWLKYRKKRCDNTSGFRGVSRRNNGKFRAQIGFKGKSFYIGTFDTFEEAVQQRLEAEALVHDAFVEQYEKWETLAKLDQEWAKNNPIFFEVQKINGTLVVTSSE